MISFQCFYNHEKVLANFRNDISPFHGISLQMVCGLNLKFRSESTPPPEEDLYHLLPPHSLKNSEREYQDLFF